jgi:7-cyano-7-deazaguanine reductase
LDKIYKKIQSLKLVYLDKPQPGLLVAMPNPYPDRDYEIQVVSPEFTAVCPVNPGQPDFATFTIKYVPDKLIVELKSLKLYLTSYRNVAIFYEASTNQVLDDLVKSIHPRSMEITADWNTRGGITARITSTYVKPRTKKGG